MIFLAIGMPSGQCRLRDRASDRRPSGFSSPTSRARPELQHRLGERYQESSAEHRRLVEAALRRALRRRRRSPDRILLRRLYASAPRGSGWRRSAARDRRARRGPTPRRSRSGWASTRATRGRRRPLRRPRGLTYRAHLRLCARGAGPAVLLRSRAPLRPRAATAPEKPRLRISSRTSTDPEPISQLIVDGLPSQFPAARDRSGTFSAKSGSLRRAGGLRARRDRVVWPSSCFTSGRLGRRRYHLASRLRPASRTRSSDAIDLGFKSNLIAAGESTSGSSIRRQHAAEDRPVSERGRPASLSARVGAGDPFGLAVGREPCGSLFSAGPARSCSSSAPTSATCERDPLRGGGGCSRPLAAASSRRRRWRRLGARPLRGRAMADRSRRVDERGSSPMASTRSRSPSGSARSGSQGL